MYSVFTRLTQALLVLLCLNSTSSAAVIVNYFHGSVRCDTCLMIEQFAENVLEQVFADELDKGHLVWQSINIDITENKHFINKYTLSASDLVVYTNQDQAIFIKVPDIWQLVNDYQKFKATLSRIVEQALRRGIEN